MPDLLVPKHFTNHLLDHCKCFRVPFCNLHESEFGFKNNYFTVDYKLSLVSGILR